MIIDEQHQEQARRSFWAYRQLANKKLKKGWWQREIAKELQQFYDDYCAGLRPKLVIQAPPQHGKSTQIIDFIAWFIGNSEDKRFIYASFSDRLGVRANTKLKKILTSELYAEIFPDVALSNPVTQEIISIGDEGFFRNTTVGGQITGESLDIGIIDDPIKGREAANSETIREKVWDWFTDDFSTRFADDGALLCILTRWHIDDPIGRLLEIDKSVKVLSYPAIAEKDEANRRRGDPLFPEHKSREFLETIKQRMALSSWNSLYQQNPTIAEGNMFKPASMAIVSAILQGAQFVRAWDLASTAGGGDYTVGLKLARLMNGSYLVADIVRIQGGPDEVLAAIKNTAALDGRGVKIFIPQDPGQAGKSQIVTYTRELAGYAVMSKTMSGDKVVRADPVAAQCNIGNVAILKGEWNKDFIDELRTFPNGKHDDQIDALSSAFDVFTGGIVAQTDGFQSANSGGFFNYSGRAL